MQTRQYDVPGLHGASLRYPPLPVRAVRQGCYHLITAGCDAEVIVEPRRCRLRVASDIPGQLYRTGGKGGSVQVEGRARDYVESGARVVIQPTNIAATIEPVDLEIKPAVIVIRTPGETTRPHLR